MSTRLDNLIKRRDEVKIIISRLVNQGASGSMIASDYRKELEKLGGQIETEKTA